MAYEMMSDYRRRGFLPAAEFETLPIDPNDERVIRAQQTGQSQAAPSPSPVSGMRMMDIPEGANVRRTITMNGDDGSREQTVASWIHSPTQPAQMEQPGRFERLERQKDSMGGSVQARARRFQGADRMRMMEANRLDRIVKEDADRANAQTIEAIKAGGEIGGKQAVAQGMRGQGVEAAALTAQADAAKQEQAGFFKGLDYIGRQQDDARSNAQLALNTEQVGMQRDQFERNKSWDNEVRMRSQADIEAGRKSGQPFETYFDPQSKRQFYRAWGDVDPRTGEKTGWKPVTSDQFGMLAGGPPEPGAQPQPANAGTQAPAQAAAQTPLRRKTQDGRTALYDPNTKMFLGYAG